MDYDLCQILHNIEYNLVIHMIKPCNQEKTIGEKNANSFYHKEVGSTFALNSMCEKGHYILHIQYSHFHSKCLNIYKTLVAPQLGDAIHR